MEEDCCHAESAIQRPYSWTSSHRMPGQSTWSVLASQALEVTSFDVKWVVCQAAWINCERILPQSFKLKTDSGPGDIAWHSATRMAKSLHLLEWGMIRKSFVVNTGVDRSMAYGRDAVIDRADSVSEVFAECRSNIAETKSKRHG